MMNISLDLSNKIPAQTIEILQKVTDTAEKLDIPIFLIGATAREFVLQHGYNLPKTTKTRDIDFGVAVKDWREYEKLKMELVKTGKFIFDSKAVHRLTENSSQTKIDFVPFGEIESPPGEVTFQNETTMNLTGFSEVYNSALTVKLSANLVLKIVSPVGLALLKLFSWNDRLANKDASDFWLIARNYLDIANNEERIYEKYASWLEDENYDVKINGAKLLGIDIAEISSEETKSQVIIFFENHKKLERFASEIMRIEKSVENNFDFIMLILNAVGEGLKKS
ncbi:nucleotidyl transferase AbiEii/AbiGii toxin family protein [soil metagenome]